MTVELSLPALSDPAMQRRTASALHRTAQVVERAVSMDPQALLRIRPAALEGTCDVFISTPLGCATMQRIPGTVAAEGTVMAADVPERLRVDPSELTKNMSTDLGADMSLMWTGSLPPQDGFEWVDNVPAGEIRKAHATMGRENAEASAPAGIARSLLDQKVVELASEDKKQHVAITGRIIAAIGGLGIAAQPGAQELQKYDFLRISVTDSWIRIDALFGTIYAPRPGGLARVPQPR